MWTPLLLTAGLTFGGSAADGALEPGGPTPFADRDFVAGQQEREGRPERGGRSPRGGEDELPFVRTEGARIAWYPSLAQARAEAERTGKPILLQSAAPQCHEVPGIWWPGYRELEGRVLSDPRIVELSRDFVCVRPNTYENEEEAEFMKTLFRSRNDNLQNTTFCLLAPDGETQISRGGRSPSMVFGGIEGLSAELEKLTGRYPAKDKPRSSQAVYPAQESVAVGLNVAASDGLPLVLLAGGTDKQRAQIAGSMAALAFSEAVIGRLHYGVVDDAGELALLERGEGELALPERPELWLVRPEPFARNGEVVERYPLPADNPALWSALSGTVAAAWESALPQKAETAREHLREGDREGIKWESELPVTDGDSSGASERPERRRR